MTKKNKITVTVIICAVVLAVAAVGIVFLIKGLGSEKTFTVSFNSMGGDQIEPIQVEKGTDLRFVDLPQAQKEGVSFCAWYADEALTTEYYDTDCIVNKDITLYAGYEEYQELVEYSNAYDVGETTLDISSDENIELFSSVELTNDNLNEHITLLNQLEVSGGITPKVYITKTSQENVYRLSPIGRWPEGGMYIIEASDEIKFILESDEHVVGNDGAAVVASKVNILVDIAEEVNNVEEADSVIIIDSDDYESFNEDVLLLKAAAISKYNISEGMLLKVMLGDGTHQYIKAGKCEAASDGGLVIKAEAALPGEVFSEFEVAAKAEDAFLSDHFGNINKQTVLTSLTSNPNFVILEDLATLSAVDYANKKGIADVSGVTLLSGMSVGDVSGVAPIASVGNLNFIWETVAGPEILNLPEEYQLLRTGVSFDVIYDDDTYARITLEIQTGSCYGLLIHGQSKKLIPVSDVWFNARLKADYVTVFKFNIVMYDGDNVYDASEEMNSFGSKDPESLVSKYKELIELDTERLKIIDEDLYAIPFNLLDIIVIRVPFGLEVEIDLNGSFSTEIINRVAHFYGVNGSVKDGFDFWDAHCWQMQYETTSYYGKFDISIGVRSGLTIGLAGMDTLGRFGVKAEIGVYYQFLGYGYTKSSYRSWNEGLNKGDDELKKDKVDSTHTSSVNGAIYNELGLYLQFGIYVESEIFSAKAELESPQIRIKLMEQGNLYDDDGVKTPLLALGFGTVPKSEAEKTLVVTDYGVQVEELPFFEIMYLNLKTGSVITKRVDFSNFVIKDCGIIYYDKVNKLLMPRRNVSKTTRMDSYINIRYVDDSLYYIDDYQTKYYVQENNTKVLKKKGAYTELKIPVTYLPQSLAEDADKVNDVMTVHFRVDDTVVRSLEVKYGATIKMALAGTETSVHDYIMASGADFTKDPNISAISIPQVMYNTPITEDTYVDIEVHYIGVPIIVRYVSGIREEDGFIYYTTRNGHIAWCKSRLLDELSEFEADVHENMKFVGWRYVDTGEMVPDDRLVDVTDSKKLEVEAVYERAPITVTVNIEGFEYGSNSFGAATYTYNINAGEGIADKLRGDVGRSFILGNWAMYVTEYEKYAESFDINFFEDKTINISWYEMPAEFKVTFDPNGGEFAVLGASQLTNGVYIAECANGFIFTNDIQDILAPIREDDTAKYTFLGWYYLEENGDKAFGVKPAAEDRTYYAEWLKEEKYFDITLNAEGNMGDTPIAGEFIDGKTTRVISLKYSEIQKLAEEIKNGIFDPILTPTAGKYVFDCWVLTSEENGNYTFTASYAEGLVSVTILSSGPCGNETAEGAFAEGTVTSLTLTPSKWAEMREHIEAGDYSELPAITPLSEAYLFNGWRVSTYSELEYSIIPLFKENKEITITISAVGDYNGTAVPGTLSGVGEIVLRETAANAFINKVYNADYSELPTVTPDSDEYIFSRWQVSYTSATECLITPIYGRGAFATITYDLGRGSNANGIEGVKSYTIEIIGETLDFSIQDHMKPVVAFSVNGYNESGRFTDYACFEDENYYYVFSGWRTSDGKSSWSLKHKDSVTITAEYEKLPKAYSVELEVDFSSAEKEIFIENGRPASYGLIILWGSYGTKWSEYEIPTVIKQTSDDSSYTYVFEKWVDVNTGEELPEYVEDGDRYKAVFKQVEKAPIPNSVKVTFDAGEDGYFVSTGERYKTVEYAYGTLYDDVADTLEKPVRNNEIYQFHDWIDWWYGQTLDASISVGCTYWNTERGCLEGEEDLIQVFFDAGEGAYFEANYNGAGLLVYPELDPRYFVHAWEENTLFYSGDEPANSGEYTHAYEIAYLEQFVIVKDGERYTAKWDLPEQFVYTWDVDKIVIKYTELIPFTE